ncbi:MAG: protein kinase [Candidatus Aminicenantes bacterium]|nr:protein kinase [Candidatus Aminicenantes bacterium]
MKCPKCEFENPDDVHFCGNCGDQIIPSKEKDFSQTETLRTPMRELIIGSTFAGRYQIIEELGRGGMGILYKVIDKKIEEKVALKLLRPEIASDKKTIERFRNELKFARKISHRNVCRMYDLSEEEGTQYITMEYISGEDLKSSIRRMEQLTIGKAISIAKQVCEGLAEAHRLGVIHRDLKPRNIMIDREGNARIMDFGIARSMGTEGITDAGVMIGTPEYMSPEQVEGKDIDHRTDVYSLGVILYEMLTGVVPFEGDTPLNIAMKIKTEIPEEPRKLNAQIPEELNNVILKCMEKDREKRYQSVEELFAELRRIEKRIPTTERLFPGRGIPAEKRAPSKSKKVLVPALVVVAVVIAGLAIWRFIIQPRATEPKPPPAPPRVEDYFEAGHKYWEKKKYSKAIDQFEKILALEPENLEATISLATILKEQGKIEKAIPEYEKAIALSSSDPRPYLHLGEIHEKEQELEKAVSFYRKFLDAAPEEAEFAAVEQKIADLEAKYLPEEEEEPQVEREIIPAEKPEPPPEPVKREPVKKEPVEKEPVIKEPAKVDVSADLEAGIKAFNQGDFDRCITQMEKVLNIEPGNTTAQYHLDEAKKKQRQKLIEQEIQASLKVIQEAFERGEYRECMERARRVLELDPKNAQAKKYLNQASLNLAPEQIGMIVHQYVQSINNQKLLTFYKNTCSPKLYQQIKKDAELLSKLYDKHQSLASDINVRFEGMTRAEVTFSHMMAGVSKAEGRKQVLFEGTLKWMMEKQGESWKIIEISSYPHKKKQN